MAKQQTRTIPLAFTSLPGEEMQARAREFKDLMATRRTVRDFSDKTVPEQIIEQCLETAGSAPSGANRQPWHFAVVRNPTLKRKIRLAAEEEEEEFYNRRAPQDWLDALAPLGTDAEKPFLEKAPCLIVVFAEKYKTTDAGKAKNYYVTESASLATGLLLSALHNAGLATLTHTPSPMKFLNKLLGRPEQEKPLMIVVAGFPAEDARVPDIARKTLTEFVSFHD